MFKAATWPMTKCAISLYRLLAQRNLHASTSSALVTRITSLLVNIAGVPIVLSILGSEQYGALMVLSGVVAWISLGSFGLNGFVTSEVASNRNDRDHLARVLKDGFSATASLAGIALVIAGLVLYGAFRWGWLGFAGMDRWSGMQASAVFLLAITYIQLLLSPVEAAQLGLQSSWVSNMHRSAGNILSCVLIFALPFLPRSMLFPAMALFLPVTLAIAANALPFVKLVIARPSQKRDRPLREHFQSIRQSLPFFAVSLYALCINTFTTVYVSALAGPAEAATTSIFVRILTIAMSIPVLFTGPLWAAIVDARHQSDAMWIRRMVWASFPPLLGGALLFCGLLAVFGGQIVMLWTKHMLHFDPLLPAFCAASLFLILWSHLWSTLLMGLGLQSFVAKVQLAELVVIAGLGAWLVAQQGSLGMFEAMLVGMVICSGFAFPIRGVREFRRLHSGGIAA